MSVDIEQLLGESLGYRDRVPLDCEPLAAPLDDAQLLRLAERNVTALRAAAVLEDRHPGPEDQSGLEGEVARLEIKVDLLIDLMSAVMSLQQPPPAAHEVTMTSTAVAWVEAGREFAVGETYMLSLFPYRSPPQSLQWPVRIECVVGDAGGHRVGARFAAMPEAMAHQVERLVFRRHRRRIADERQARQRSSSEARPD